MKKDETSEWMKNCPECQKIMYYSTENNLHQSTKRNCLCLSCANRNNNLKYIPYKGEIFSRNCPICGSEIIYKLRKSMHKAIKENFSCLSCSNIKHLLVKGFKKCSICNQLKSVNCFKRHRDVLHPRCTSCRDKFNLEYRQSLKGRFLNYKSTAKNDNRLFELTLKQFEVLINSNCHYCDGPGFGIDRMDSSLGYIDGNMLPCCSQCNRMKSIYSYDEFIKKCRSIVTNFNKSSSYSL